MSKAVCEYILNIWRLWSAKAPLYDWYGAFVLKVREACRWSRIGWSDDAIIRWIRYTREDAEKLAACGDPYDDYYTE